MEDIYIFAIVFAVLMVYFGICWLIWRENPIWRRAQLRMLTVGQVRRNLLSSQDKDGCIIYVVKAINKKTIISDTYIKKNGKYVLDIQDRELTIKEFYKLTDPEPVYKEDRICAETKSKKSSAK